MIRDAGQGDAPLLVRLLTAHIDGAMFPLANLRDHGFRAGGFACDHSHATRFWLVGENGIVALTQGGTIMAVGTDPRDLSGLPQALKGQTIQGASGPSAAVRPVLTALGLQGTPARLDKDEWGFALDLARLQIPATPAHTLVPAAGVPRALLIDWRAEATVETQGMPPAQAPDQAATDVDDWLSRDSHRVLHHHGQPVALTGFNAQLPGIVQIGGVYTPPAFRNRGHARTAVALHLAEARAIGTCSAVLFTASPAAARAYLAIGFRPAPDFALVLFRQPVTLPP